MSLCVIQTLTSMYRVDIEVALTFLAYIILHQRALSESYDRVLYKKMMRRL